MSQSFEQFMLRAWYEGRGWLKLLRPLSLLYRTAAVSRRRRYLNDPKASWQPPVPLIVVGNITLGGTGKSDQDRHPKIGNGVLIGAGAKILGNIEVGRCARIAAGSVVLAGQQSSGRGRPGRSWSSPAGNLYASVLLRVEAPLATSAQLSFVTGLALADALQQRAPDGVVLRLKISVSCPAATSLGHRWTVRPAWLLRSVRVALAPRRRGSVHRTGRTTRARPPVPSLQRSSDADPCAGLRTE